MFIASGLTLIILIRSLVIYNETNFQIVRAEAA